MVGKVSENRRKEFSDERPFSREAIFLRWTARRIGLRRFDIADAECRAKIPFAEGDSIFDAERLHDALSGFLTVHHGQ